jgi:hypothetical protein
MNTLDRLIEGPYRWPLRLDLPFRLAVAMVALGVPVAFVLALTVGFGLLLRLALYGP